MVALLDVLGFLSLALSAGGYGVLAPIRHRVRWHLRGLLLTIPSGLLPGYDAAPVAYRLNPTTRIPGFPVPSSLLELHAGAWWNYPGPGAVYGILGNFFVGLTVPHAVLLTASLVWAKSQTSGLGAAQTPRSNHPEE
ncbi:MAG TPA: hypothetical protein VMU54_20380 [Planctomycetota bacterium]|nr:hypothetical protein [Planctomycetota bacterium]